MDLSLKLARPAENTPIPETLGELWELLAQNAQVVGPQISEGSGALPMQVYRRQGDQETELTGEDSAIWIETNAENRPVALKLYWGDAWHNFGDLPRGTTAERDALTDIGDYEPFYDTDLGVMLIWDPNWSGGSWITQEGSPGDIKPVHAVDEAAAVAANPGWIIYEAAREAALIGVNPDSDEEFSFTGEEETEALLSKPGRILGNHTTNLRIDELPPHKFAHWRTQFWFNAGENGFGGPAAFPYNMPTIEEVDSVGVGNPLDIRQKSLTVFWLIKAEDQPEIENSERNELVLPKRTKITPANVPHQDELDAARLIIGVHKVFFENQDTQAGTGLNLNTIEQMYDEIDSDADSGRKIITACKLILDTAFKHGAIKTGTGVNEEVVPLSFPLTDVSGYVDGALSGEPTDPLVYNTSTSIVQSTEFTDAKALIRNSTFYTH